MTEQSTMVLKRVSEADENRLISDWIDKNLGAHVVRIQRQGRWRPAWFVDAILDDAPLPL